MMTNIFNFFTGSDGFELFLFLIGATLKATFLIGVAALLCRAFRRFSPATRHLIWASVLMATLLLPLLTFVNGWEIPFLTIRKPLNTSLNPNPETLEIFPTQLTKTQPSNDFLADEVAGNEFEIKKETRFYSQPLLIPNISELPVESGSEQSAVFIQMINLILGVWLVGIGLFLGRLLNGIISINRLRRGGNEFENPALKKLFISLQTELNLKRKIRLLRSEQTKMPIVCGIVGPVVILPVEAENWTDERCRVVLLHELTHIARRDCLTQFLAQIACVFYWFNPLIWLAARRLRMEREQACDAFVLKTGTKPSDYAHHLLEIARTMQQQKSALEWSPNATIAMAQPSQLEERLLAILNPKIHWTSSPVTFTLLTLIILLFLSVAFIRPTIADTTSPPMVENNPESQKEDYVNKQSVENFPPANGFEQEETKREQTFENGKTDLDLEKALEKETKNEIPTEQTGQEFNLTDLEQTKPPNELENEKGSGLVTQPTPNPFVQIEFKNESQTEQQSQKQTDDFIEEMASVGYKNLSIDDLIRLKSVGVTADFVRALRSLGFDNLTVRELANLRAVGVTPKYIEEIRGAGYKDLTARELSNLRALGVTVGFIKIFRDAGYENLSIRNLTELRASNMTLEFINTMNSLGFGKLTLKELTNLKFMGVTPEFVRLARTRLGNDLTLKQIVGLKNTGVLKEKEKQ
jgi:beta-lactamase regulating signal transducer with metallopeptidase domain